jgi:hypothetical protein
MVRKQGHVSVPKPMAETFSLAREAVTLIGGRIVGEDRERGTITAQVPFSFKSWGEVVTVQLSGVDGDVGVDVASQSSWRMTLGDWGKNRHNVDLVLQFLNARSK